MAKRTRTRKSRPQSGGRQTNWVIIGAVAFLGVVALGALLYLTLQQPEAPQAIALEEYCQQNAERCVSKGDASAPVTVIEVSDYGCPHCANFNRDTAPLLDEAYVDNGQVRWIILPYALNPTTAPTSAAAMCALDQGMFWEFHQAMFAIQADPDALTRNGWERVAESIGMDTDRFSNCLNSNTYRQVIADNSDAAALMGVTGTPAFFINGVQLEGNQPMQVFQQRISALLEGS